MNRKQITPVILLIAILLLAIYFGTTYTLGLKFLISLIILWLLFLLLDPVWLFYLLILLFWFPYSFNYLFFKEIFVNAYIGEVLSYVLLIMYIGLGFVKNSNIFKRLSDTPLKTSIFIFILANFISYVFFADKNNDFAYILFRQNCFYSIAIYILAANIISKIDKAKKAIFLLIISYLILASFLYYSFYFRVNLVDVLSEGDRLGGVFVLFGKYPIAIGCIFVGIMLANLIPFVAMFIFSNEKTYYKLLSILVLIMFSTTMIYSGTRSAWIGALVGVFPLLSYFFKNKKLSFFSKFLFFIGLIIVVLTLYYVVKYSIEINNYLIFRFDSLKRLSGDESLLSRLDIWMAGFQEFLKNPLGLGFREVYQMGASVKYPHSLYIGILLSSGFLGFMGFFSFIILWFKKVVSFIKTSDGSVNLFLSAAQGSTVAFLVTGIFEDPTHNSNIIMPMMWLIWGISIALCRTRTENA